MLRSPMKNSKQRLKKCKVCPVRFDPRTAMQTCCCPACAISYAKATREKKEKRERIIDRIQTKAKLDAMKPRAKLIKEAQTEFNRFIRARDSGLPCICCNRTGEDKSLTGSKWDAGHYRSTGSAPHLRFNEDNVHRQLVFCNQYGSGRAVDYRIGLIKKIGIERVEALESNNTARKYTVDELKQIKETYRAKHKELAAKQSLNNN